jgi:hypothetical protein
MNFIHIGENAISHETCDELICLFEFNKHLHEQGSIVKEGNSIVDPTYKKSTEISIDQSFLSDPLWSFSIGKILDSLYKEADRYKENFSNYEDGRSILGLDSLDRWSIDDTFNFQKYNPHDAYYSWHCEVGGLETSKRILAWMIYLNDVEDGGGTEFKFQNYTSKAQKGKLLIWPAYWTHMHRGVPSKTQEKYILTGWFSFI